MKSIERSYLWHFCYVLVLTQLTQNTETKSVPPYIIPGAGLSCCLQVLTSKLTFKKNKAHRLDFELYGYDPEPYFWMAHQPSESLNYSRNVTHMKRNHNIYSQQLVWLKDKVILRSNQGLNWTGSWPHSERAIGLGKLTWLGLHIVDANYSLVSLSF